MTVDDLKKGITLCVCVANNKRIADDIFSFPCIADISYVFRYVSKDDGSGLTKSFLLTKQMVNYFFDGCTISDVKKDLLMSVVDKFNQYEDIVIASLKEFVGLGEENDPELIIVTNKSMIYGAAMAFMYMPYISCYLNSHYGVRNFYILPSSIHKCLIVPDRGKTDGVSTKDLKSLVREVNANPFCIDARSVLSDNVFYYSEKVGRIQVVEDDQNEDSVQG